MRRKNNRRKTGFKFSQWEGRKKVRGAKRNKEGRERERKR